MKEVLVELDRYLEDLAFAFMGEPGVGDVGADKHQFEISSTESPTMRLTPRAFSMKLSSYSS